MIELCNVSKTFGTHPAVQDVSLAIPDKARIAVLGPSGSGKSTLLRLIAGLEIPDRGKILMDGALASSPEYMLPPSDRNLGFVFQDSALWPHMTVEENILFPLDDITDEARDRVADLEARLGIENLKRRFPNQISGGEARRVALARALVSRPKTLLFDEPLTNLDRALRDDLLDLICDTIKSLGACIVYVTHDEHEAGAVADTVIRFQNGQITGK